MRIDPEAVYLEIQEQALVFNFTTSKERYVPAVTLHWKDGSKWQKRSFVGDGPDGGNGKTLGAVLSTLGTWLDERGLQGALDEAMGREPEPAPEPVPAT